MAEVNQVRFIEHFRQPISKTQSRGAGGELADKWLAKSPEAAGF